MAPRTPDFAQPQRFSTPWRCPSSGAVTHRPALVLFLKGTSFYVTATVGKTLAMSLAALIAPYASCRSLVLLEGRPKGPHFVSLPPAYDITTSPPP